MFLALTPAISTELWSTNTWIILIAVMLIVGITLGWLLNRLATGSTLKRAKTDAERITHAAEIEGEAIKQKSELEAEKKARERRDALDKEITEALADLKRDQKRLAKREDTLDKKFEEIAAREKELDTIHARLKGREEDLEKKDQLLQESLQEARDDLEKIAHMSTNEAREVVLDEVRIEAEHDANVMTQQIIDEAEVKAREQSREITIMAIQRYAAEHVTDFTVRSVRIPSDDMKGRIIGREGRNIRTLERATGVDILVDDTPGVIAVSCFDPIRRTIAAESLQKLVADGRVHPARIEEIVEGVRKDMGERIIKHGNDAALEANIRGLHPKIIEAMGKMHFRTSFGQNVLRHSMEVAYLSQIIADQLDLDGDIARRCGFLHDIGKAMDHEMEGGHPAIGMEFCRKYREKSEIVLNAIGGHHNDIPSISPYTPIVMAADAISGARPGARRESMEMYVKRLEELEEIAKTYEQVTEAHAIQAGREIRVIVDAKRADDADAFMIARKIAKQVEEQMTFPGEIKVTVLREVRAQATAR
ncbi:MAG: ribonuclease Y [Planctomycetes bacterium]|nr:ribonuclease Y [Planctomycetota bacterium]